MHVPKFLPFIPWQACQNRVHRQKKTIVYIRSGLWFPQSFVAHKFSGKIEKTLASLRKSPLIFPNKVARSFRAEVFPLAQLEAAIVVDISLRNVGCGRFVPGVSKRGDWMLECLFCSELDLCSNREVCRGGRLHWLHRETQKGNGYAGSMYANWGVASQYRDKHMVSRNEKENIFF